MNPAKILQHFPHAVINWIEIWQIWRSSWGVSFCNNSTVTCAQWAFHVTQGSVETLFRWGEKPLHHFEANLFRKQSVNFHRNLPSFIWDITKTFWSLFFLGHCVLQKLSTVLQVLIFYSVELCTCDNNFSHWIKHHLMFVTRYVPHVTADLFHDVVSMDLFLNMCARSMC